VKKVNSTMDTLHSSDKNDDMDKSCCLNEVGDKVNVLLVQFDKQPFNYSL
jgi:hypothetical protein